MRSFALLSLFVLLTTPVKIFACSFATSTEKFLYSNDSAETPIKPSFTIESVYRGHKDGTNCGGFASLVLHIDPEPKNVGYLFSVVEGEVERLEFSKEPIVRIQNNSETGIYSFIWFDGYSNKQEAIDVKLKIVAVSKNGIFSKPQYLKFNHPGVKVPWWKFW